MIDRQDSIFGFEIWTFCVYCQIVGWASQLIGHGLFEKRAPALKTNVLFIFLAPFFVMFEVLYYGLGYKNNQKTKKVMAEIEEDIKQFQAGKTK